MAERTYSIDFALADGNVHSVSFTVADGEDYVLTDTDRTDIASKALELMEQAEDFTYGG